MPTVGLRSKDDRGDFVCESSVVFAVENEVPVVRPGCIDEIEAIDALIARSALAYMIEQYEKC